MSKNGYAIPFKCCDFALYWWTVRSVLCVCTHSNKLVHCWFLVFFPLLLFWNVSLFIYLFSFWSFEQQKREREQRKWEMCVDLFINCFLNAGRLFDRMLLYGKLVFAFWNRWCTWEIGVCNELCIWFFFRFCILLHRAREKCLWFFSICISFAKWWNFFLSEITFCFGIIFAIFSWFNVNA